MITDQETLALLAEVQRFKLEVLTTEPTMQMARLKELLANAPPAYRLIIERIYLDDFDLKVAIDKIQARSGLEAEPKTLGEASLALLRWLPRQLRYPVLALVLLTAALFTVWKSLPASVQSGIIEPPSAPRKSLLVVTIETAGPIQGLPGGEYAFPLALHVENTGAAPVHVEPGILLLGGRAKPCLAGLVLFKTSMLGAHASRQESLRVKLIPFRPEALPTKAGERLRAGWLRLSVVGEKGREEPVACELDPQSLLWLPAGTTAAP